MAAGVTTQAGVMWNTVSDSSSVVQLNPPLRQAAVSLPASGEADKDVIKLGKRINIS